MNNNDNKEKLRAETIAMLRAVLISSPLGVPFEKLYRDYKQLTGKMIPHKELGFPKLEFFIQSIPDVAKAEKGTNGEWTIKGVASDADKHVAKLISKQKKPRVRKSAKLMISRRPTRPPVKLNTPVKAPTRAPMRFMPPRMRRLQKEQGQTRTNRLPPSDLRQKLNKGISGGAISRKVTNDVKICTTGKNNKCVANSQSSAPKNIQERGLVKEKIPVFSKMAISISNDNSGRSVRAVTASSAAPNNCSLDMLNDPLTVKWIKEQIQKAPNGLWATRLAHLYQEEFNKTLTEDTMKELKLRPDIAKVEEPIGGKFLLYCPVKQELKLDSVPQKASASKQQESSLSNKNLDVVLPYLVPDIGSSCTVYITHFEHVGCFYVSKTDAISADLTEAIYKHYESSKYDVDAIPSIQPDQIFCAQYTEDEYFYRSRVLEVVDNKHVRVQYVDFGNQEVIDLNRLRILVEKFHSQPAQALQCRLVGIQPLDEGSDWSQASLEKFKELCSNKVLKMTVKDREDKILSVSLYQEFSNLDVGEELVKAGVASATKSLSSAPSSSPSSVSSSTGFPSEETTPPRKDGITRSRRVKTKSPGIVELPDDSFIDVLVCNITGTYNIYLRLVGDEYSNKFEAIQESMTCYYSDSKDEVTTEPATGDLFALLSEEVWCRVKVLSVDGPTINVFFVDHGDTTETTKAELRALAPQFQQLPLQVFECALNGLPKTKNPDVVDKLQKLVMGEVCVVEVVKKTADLVFVELIDPRGDANIVVNDIIRELVISDEELKPVLPKVGETIDVNVPYISPSGNVFVHVLGAGTKRLNELNHDLTDHYVSKRSKANEFISNPVAGKVCCAKCEQDGCWYRVKIISASKKNAVEVFYVDYGNCDTVPSTNLREPTQANDHVLSLPFQALECQLYDVPKNDWNKDLANRMLGIIEQGSVTAEILCEGDIPSVSLLVTIMAEDNEEITERLTTLLGIQYDAEDIKDPTGTDLDIDNDKNLYDGEKNVLDNDKSGANENTDDKVGMNPTVAYEKTNDHDDEKNIADDSRNRDASYSGVFEEKIVRSRDNSLNSAQDAPRTSTERIEAKPVGQAADKSFPGKVLALDSGWLDIYVTEVKDPEHFTFQLLQNSDELYNMNEKLNEHYQNRPTGESSVMEGCVYAVLHDQDDYWYRAIVDSIIKNEKAYVLFVDYGDNATIDIESIQPLDDQFLVLPFQGVQASLAGVKCAEAKWSKAFQKYFRQCTFNKELVAKVTSGDMIYRFGRSPRVLVELYDTSDPTNDISIAKLIQDFEEE